MADQTNMRLTLKIAFPVKRDTYGYPFVMSLFCEICYFHHNLEHTVADCIETFFSTNGQWIENRHNYA